MIGFARPLDRRRADRRPDRRRPYRQGRASPRPRFRALPGGHRRMRFRRGPSVPGPCSGTGRRRRPLSGFRRIARTWRASMTVGNSRRPSVRKSGSDRHRVTDNGERAGHLRRDNPPLLTSSFEDRYGFRQSPPPHSRRNVGQANPSIRKGFGERGRRTPCPVVRSGEPTRD